MTMETNPFFTVLFAAMLVEAIINILENVQEKETSWKYWASLAGGLVVSILIAVNWDLDIFKMVGFPSGNLPFVGAILTGIILSRGSNVISDLLSRLNFGK